MSGFIKLNRKFFDNILWNEARVYSKAEAWLDMIQSARFEASTELINGKLIEVQRGEFPASRRYLEMRWGWGSTKVSNFLKTLTKLGMINQRQTEGQTVYSLVNYGVYNNKQTTDKPVDEPPTNQRQTRGKPPTNQSKESKEGKEFKELKEKSGSKRSLPDRLRDFEIKVFEFAKGTTFDSHETLREFCAYWTEHGEKDRKMRFEKQTSFDINRRLGTWFRNQEKFNGKIKFKNSSVTEYSNTIS